MAKDIKGGSIKNTDHECIKQSLKYAGKSLGSSADTVNPYSIRKSGKKIS